MPLFHRTLPALAVLLPLAACAGPQAQAPARKAPPVARGTTEPLRFTELALGSLRRGAIIGRYVWDIDCAPPYEDVYWTTGRNLRQGSTVEERFAEALTDAGFDVAGRLDGGREPEMDRRRARFAVQGDLRDIRLELCRRKHWLTGSGKGESGTGSVRVDWSVFDAATGRLVHRVTTSGVARKEAGVPQGEIMLIEEAFATAAEALAADPGFRNALAKGGVSSGGGGASTAAAHASTARADVSTGGESASSGVGGVSNPLPLDAPWAPLDTPSASLDAPWASLDAHRGPVDTRGRGLDTPVRPVDASSPPLDTPAAPLDTPTPSLVLRTPAPVERLAEDPAARVSAATIRVGEGHGVVVGDSGGQSMILAPQGVAEPRAVVRPGAGVTLDGVVAARDAPSGFVLLRVPARLPAVPLRVGEAPVSEPVTAVIRGGADAASGIIAALRPDLRSGIETIQADLDGPVPQPGDPLVDESGNLLGLAQAGLGAGSGTGGASAHGLTAFLPVGAVLTRMGVALTQAPASPPSARASKHRPRRPASGVEDGPERPS